MVVIADWFTVSLMSLLLLILICLKWLLVV